MSLSNYVEHKQETTYRRLRYVQNEYNLLTYLFVQYPTPETWNLKEEQMTEN